LRFLHHIIIYAHGGRIQRHEAGGGPGQPSDRQLQFYSSGLEAEQRKRGKIIPDLKDVIESIPKEAPVIFFCLDNTVFKVATAEGDLTNISKCVAKDDGFHINGSLVVAPDFFIRADRTAESSCVLLRRSHSPHFVSGTEVCHLPLLRRP
jgi:hypothetical protein